MAKNKQNEKATDSNPKEWENIFANHIPDKWLIYKIYKEFIQFNI